MLDADRLGKLVDQCWGDAVVPTLVEYIRIPNKSPSFDPQWAEHGYMDDAVKLFESWARDRLQALPGATLDIVRLPGRTPLMLIEVPASGGQAECRYGAAVRPSRQAAGDGRLGRGLWAVDTEDRGRQAIRPRRRR